MNLSRRFGRQGGGLNAYGILSADHFKDGDADEPTVRAEREARVHAYARDVAVGKEITWRARR